MNKINTFFFIAVLFLIFSCINPGNNPDNPDLRVINSLENYKISQIKFNNRLFTGLDEYLLPGDTTEYMKVDASPNVMLSYRWENVNNANDYGETGTMFTEGDFEGFEERQIYTVSITGDKNLPDLYIYQP